MNANPLWRKAHTDTFTLDRRIEGRQGAHGEVLVVPSDFGARPVEGELVDTSEQGFRIKYANTSPLSSGQEVHFLLPGYAGVARVIWTRVADSGMESGCLILRSCCWEK